MINTYFQLFEALKLTILSMRNATIKEYYILLNQGKVCKCRIEHMYRIKGKIKTK